MVNDVIDGISKTLGDNFSGVKIYSEAIKQGMQEPCFFILTIEGSESPLLGNRAMRNITFDVHYFPEESHYELQDTASRLYVILRQFALLNGNLVKALNMRHEVEDGVLHFIFEVKPIIYYVKTPETIMEILNNQIWMKGD